MHLFPEFSRAADVNRFGARYRLASAFRGVTLEGYGEATSAGYDALTRLTLAWSAFEGLLPAIRMTTHQYSAITARYDPRGCLEDVRRADPPGRVIEFVADHLKSERQRTILREFLQGNDCCLLTMAAAVRHVFVHSALTPNANQADPAAVVRVCDRLTAMLTRVMNREFSERVERLVEMFPDNPILDDVPF